ncbi:MAG: DUF1211 domain-containing protein [Thermoleophilaceae bacterium]|nr:DUF1211 domain-containing protein [Thermoleophilaceae bacterium]
MTDGEHPTKDFLPKGRLEAFADGVLAIVITLLVLELKVPELEGNESLLRALADEWRSFAGYLISFVFVGGVWIAHSNATRLIARGDAILFRLNLLFLFFVSLLPFTTILMTDHLGDNSEATAVAIYGLDLFIATLMLNAFIGYAADNDALVADEVADHELYAIVRQRRKLLGLQGAATVTAFLLPGVAILLYLLSGVAFIVAPLLSARSSRSHPAGLRARSQNAGEKEPPA